MLFKTKEFTMMQSGLDALWMKQRVIQNNIANYETPGFKTKHVSFHELLSTEMKDGKPVEVSNYNATITTDQSTSARLDGNNVDLDKESLELWEAYAQYAYLTDKVKGQFTNMRYVINSFK